MSSNGRKMSGTVQNDSQLSQVHNKFPERLEEFSHKQAGGFDRNVKEKVIEEMFIFISIAKEKEMAVEKEKKAKKLYLL
jgi:hypothetical protein